MSDRVTQRDVAARAGVSRATVSMALAGHQGIPEKTRTHIKAIAAAIGYTPDPMLGALSSYRKLLRPQAYQANIAWINNYEVPGDLYHDDFGEYYKGAFARSQELGFFLEEYRIKNEPGDWAHLKRLLNHKGVKGILISPSERPGARFELDLTDFSAVRLGYSYAYPELNTAGNSQFTTTLLAMQRLVALGYRRIGFVIDEKIQKRTRWRFFGGFCAGQQLLRAKDRIAPLYLPENGNYPRIIAHWARKHRLDCIVSLHGRWRYQHVVDGGLEVPAEIGYADVSLPENEDYLSGVCQDSRQVGIIAMDLLVGMIHRQETGIPKRCCHVMNDGYWIEGKTTRRQSVELDQ